MSNTKLRALEMSCAATLRNALAARKRLSAAREAADEVDVRAFLTLDEHRKIVRRMRSEHQAEIMVVVKHFMSPPDPVYRRLAELAMQAKEAGHQARRDSLHVVKNKED